jgi:IclR family acetate operon transcriptional repressor
MKLDPATGGDWHVDGRRRRPGRRIAAMASELLTQGEARPRVQSAARAVGILLEVAQSESGLTTKEISERVGIGRQATYHLLHTLVETGMVTRAERSRYVLGLRVGTLAEGFARQLAPGEHLAPIVRELAQKTGETAYATGWWSNEIAVLTVARGTNPVRAAEVSQGHVGDAHARASGKLLLAFAPPGTRSHYLDSHPRSALTANTKTDLAALEAEFDRIREQGYSEDDEEFALGLCCMAVPIDRGLSPFALSISAPRERFVERRERYLADLLQAAEVGAPAAVR